MTNRLMFPFLASLLLAAPLAGCSGGDSAATSGATSDAGGVAESTYQLQCEALSALFVTKPTASVNDWAGFFTCYGQDLGCSGAACKWSKADLPDYLLNDDCATGATHTCSIGGETVSHCATRVNTGYVEVDCGTEGEIALTGNGLPDHTMENYASAQSLPPAGVGSSPYNVTHKITLKPTYKPDISVFSMPGNTPGIMLNGIDLFNQFTGVSTVAVAEEFVDDCNGHPANGDYHYHALSSCGVAKESARLGGAGKHSGFMGISMDGFPILGPYGYADPRDPKSEVVRLESCYKLQDSCSALDASCYTFDAEAYASGTCNLDECNGRVTAVPEALQAALGKEIYAYYFTLDAAFAPAFPYMPYCFRGDYTAMGPPGGGMGGPPPGGGMGP